MKPVSGQGGGVLFIEKLEEDKFIINDSGNTLTYKKRELLDLISPKIKQEEYLGPKFFSSRLKFGHVFDLWGITYKTVVVIRHALMSFYKKSLVLCMFVNKRCVYELKRK
ncbi:MAG: hypothetical protein ACE3JQ_05220 [Paenisporosarcina sp.]